LIVPKSVLDAIKQGQWDFEPPEADPTQFEAADAMPGTKEKLLVIAERVRCGLPLWHQADREAMDAPPPLKNME
jgi:hypothetical protein